MFTQNTTNYSDIKTFAAEIQRSMYHTSKLLEAASGTTSHLPLQSLLIVCASACAFANANADSIMGLCPPEA